jgi:hypothetical protein
MKVEFVGGDRRKPRKYVGGLLPSFCDFLLDLGVAGKGYKDLDAFLLDFPLITEGVSTLTVRVGDGQKTIRGAYDAVQQYFIFEQKRLDYPRSAPYATGKWGDYRRWLDALVRFDRAQLEDVRDRSKQFVLDSLKPVIFDPSMVKVDPPIFRQLLEEFDFGDRAKGEPTGAAFQAMVFGFIRADAPHLQVEARKVRTGSARLQGIGDIDAWEGDRLVISAEVKHYVLPEKDLPGLEHFSHAVQQRAALGMVVADDFASGVRESIKNLGLHPLSLADLIQIVSLWDPVKQRAAINAFQWVVVQKEQNTGLMDRVNDFLVLIGYKVAPASALADADAEALASHEFDTSKMMHEANAEMAAGEKVEHDPPRRRRRGRRGGCRNRPLE